MSEFNIEDLEAVIAEADSSLVQMMALQLRRELEDSAKLREQLEESQREFRSADITMQNLEAKCAAMAAENAGMNKFIAESCYVQAGEDSSWHQAIDHAPETPATDAFLAEVRAQGVEMFAASLKVVGGNEHPYSAVANEFAAQLRKGAAQ